MCWEVGCVARYLRREWTGHRIVLFAARRIVMPWRKGSVLEALITMVIMSFSRVTFSRRRVERGSNFVLWVDVYSDTRRKPKYAIVMAAHSISLSSYRREELNKLLCIIWSKFGVMGRRFGTEYFRPSALLIPLMSKNRRVYSLKSRGYPFTVVWCFIAAMCSFTLLWELYDAIWVA